MVGFSHQTGEPAGSEQRDRKRSWKGYEILRLGSAIGCVLDPAFRCLDRSSAAPPLTGIVALALAWFTYGVPGGPYHTFVTFWPFQLSTPRSRLRTCFTVTGLSTGRETAPGGFGSPLYGRTSIPNLPSPRHAYDRGHPCVRIGTWKLVIDDLSNCLTTSSSEALASIRASDVMCAHLSTKYSNYGCAETGLLRFRRLLIDYPPHHPSLGLFFTFLLPLIGGKPIISLSYWSDDPISDV